ncbi:ATP-binding protein [Nocardia cyriacigeorgica]|uniref:ATP-binding protein n=1 Tax=Nocardia cyriacigeorgica TaxID=135487 RepID=A0A6P1D4J2_9NOCA|nr:ATP-binding protein [Nocardia cyriacigeorgica]NEW39798.1 ATP-binding protein [Nocardia cyriacigeorgica]NEW45525.1 ATP-binding protein [Nocardia cyriacigeorgica]NEW52432.1 ATP-binding protein [Nocardia cyriacigeorgica]NEW58645.1 ATP-binding protein [Nocardia cyriacigeorgica]
MDKPLDMFDRDHEWAALSRFVTDGQPGATLGVVSGRRRQGKTFLLEAVTRAAGGFYFGATEAADAESLRRISLALTDHIRPASPFHFARWDEVIDTLLGLGSDRPVPVVIDEFPYLAKVNPELPSIIQEAFRPLREQRTTSRTRLLLCGSALSFMGKLLSGSAPLRGRAGLELLVRPLDYQLAAEFWGITDPHLAVRVNAIVGGTPAYRREFARGDVPADAADFDSWVERTVLNPETPLFREPRYLLAEEPDLRDAALYLSVLGAVANGNATRGGIAGYLERKAADLTHPINVLEDVGLLHRDADVFRQNRSAYRISEPLIGFYHAIMRPVWDQLERPGSARRVWQASQRRFTANVLGPHFEQICREWALHHADPEVFGGLPARVGHGIVPDATGRTSHEVDVAVIGLDDGRKPPLLAIGEAKWNDTIGRAHIDRLRHIRSLIERAGRYDTSNTRLILFSGAGFNDNAVQAAASEPDISLIGLADLYG